MKRDVIVIGAGASGLVAALEAARTGAFVCLLEHKRRMGKKLLSTGNGRCNMTNLHMPPDAYRSDDPEFAGHVLAQFTVQDTLDFFEALGILTMERDGYVYPHSGQASSVLEALLWEADRLGVEQICDCEVHSVRPPAGGRPFLVKTGNGEYEAGRVILAAGSKAAPATGSDGSGYEIAAALGHRIIRPLPALVQLRCPDPCFKSVAGVRTEAAVEVLVDGRSAARDRGELQLTDYGISGIVTFQVSRYASVALDQKRAVKVRIDFLPSQTPEELEAYLNARKKPQGHKTAEAFLSGMFNQKLSLMFLKRTGIPAGQPAKQLTPSQLARLAKEIKTFEAPVSAANPFENAQVCRGGVDTRQVDPRTMESLLVPGLYFAGEILDVDGICGGYNLQWAWSTGAIAGRQAGASSQNGASRQNRADRQSEAIRQNGAVRQSGAIRQNGADRQSEAIRQNGAVRHPETGCQGEANPHTNTAPAGKLHSQKRQPTEANRARRSTPSSKAAPSKKAPPEHTNAKFRKTKPNKKRGKG